jgi:hypothetical protein
VHEDHASEQYFFDPPTVAQLAVLLERYPRPCCLCAPKVAAELEHRGRDVLLLERDARFAWLRGFRTWDLYRPAPLRERPDVFLVDPPFTKVSLSQLFTALRVATGGDFARPLFVCHLADRADDVVGALAPFGLRATSFECGYVSVRPIPEHRVLLYTNVVDPP